MFWKDIVDTADPDKSRGHCRLGVRFHAGLSMFFSSINEKLVGRICP